MAQRPRRVAVDRFFSCPQCDRRFTRPENLARHQKTHERHAKHACKICGRSFVRSDVRNRHERLHERISPGTRNLRTKSTELDSPQGETNCEIDEVFRDSVADQPPNILFYGSRDASVRPITHAVSDQRQNHVNLAGDVTHATHVGPLSSVPMDQSRSADSTPSVATTHQDPYFDYSSFARAWNDPIDLAGQNEDWFSDQFFAALHETDLWTSSNDNVLDVEMPHLESDNSNVCRAVPNNDRAFVSGADIRVDDPMSADTVVHTSHNEMYVECASRVPSPPNEASHEDRVPFAWNPSSKVVAEARAITLPENDPIYSMIDLELSLSNTTYLRMHHFLTSVRRTDQQDSFSMPCLRLANVFIGLFFKDFLAQASVIHTATTDLNNLPSPLLAIIMAIGSTYSRLRHSRRFGIILFDRIRLGLFSLIERDNSQMREPWIIYAFALTCFMGLWCGNKRAFELAELLRAAAVTYTRHWPSSLAEAEYSLHISDEGSHLPTEYTHSGRSVQTPWFRWAVSEAHKRVRWFVYMVDAQFPSVLGSGGMMTLGDIREWECPCDDQYWRATSARSWSNLVGTAARPSCPIFGPIAARYMSRKFTQGNSSTDIPRLNEWSAFLVLTAIVDNVFRAEQALLIYRMVSDDMTSKSSTHYELIDSLELWHDHHGGVSSSHRKQAPVSYFTRSSIVLYRLARLFVHIPLSDIQDCLGRNGAGNSKMALGRLGAWMQQDRECSGVVVRDAALCIDIILGSDPDHVPFDLIGLFLCHLTIWACAIVGKHEQKLEIISELRVDGSLSPKVMEFIEAGFGVVEVSRHSATSTSPQLIMRHAIQSLVRKGTWGSSSNLALLLHLHPGHQN